ncbi:MAG: alpha/beta hydrolase [Myxococcota bacterium]
MPAVSPTIRLQRGPLRFTADVVGDGPLVLCLHGFPDHRRTWRHALPFLADAGYRAVAPSLRGYEPSSVPADGDVHLSTVARDVLAWMDRLEAPRAHLVGHDWGAAVTSVVTAMAPERVASATLLAVPPLRRAGRMMRRVPQALPRLAYMAFFQLPGLPERALLANGGAGIRRLWRRWSPGWRCPEHEMRHVIETLARPGVLPAALGYYRALPDVVTPRGRETWRLLTSRLRTPSLLVAGEDDGCMDPRAWDVGVEPRDFPAGVRTERLAGAGHFMHLERPARFHEVLLEHLDG